MAIVSDEHGKLRLEKAQQSAQWTQDYLWGLDYEEINAESIKKQVDEREAATSFRWQKKEAVQASHPKIEIQKLRETKQHVRFDLGNTIEKLAASLSDELFSILFWVGIGRTGHHAGSNQASRSPGSVIATLCVVILGIAIATSLNSRTAEPVSAKQSKSTPVAVVTHSTEQVESSEVAMDAEPTGEDGAALADKWSSSPRQEKALSAPTTNSEYQAPFILPEPAKPDTTQEDENGNETETADAAAPSTQP